MLAGCYSNSNSSLRADSAINLLDDSRMAIFKNMKALRRENVAHLLDEIGQAQLGEITEIAPAFLYQMGKGKGQSARNVSDETAYQIVSRLGLPEAWLDTEHPAEDMSPLKAKADERLRQIRRIGFIKATDGDPGLAILMQKWPELDLIKQDKLLDYLDYLLSPKDTPAEQHRPLLRQKVK